MCYSESHYCYSESHYSSCCFIFHTHTPSEGFPHSFSPYFTQWTFAASERYCQGPVTTAPAQQVSQAGKDRQNSNTLLHSVPPH